MQIKRNLSKIEMSGPDINLGDIKYISKFMQDGWVGKKKYYYVEKFENDEVKIAVSEWDNKVLIRSIGTNSYYLKFAIMGLLSYILDNEIPKVWNS